MTDAPNIAVFCDYENVALGARDARYGDLDIELILQRLLDKGQIVVKKAYCDWDRYKAAKRSMHEASFELIEIPHVSYSGKNSADIRMVVDALDLCYTKPHVRVFAIISGDSDFSPLVSKLRENNKTVIGIGVKNSSSDLLVDNCDEFILYDDLVRKSRTAKHPKASSKDNDPAKPKPAAKPSIGKPAVASATAKDATAKDATAKDATAKDATAKDATAKDATAKDATAKDATAKDATAKDATAKDATRAADKRADARGDRTEAFELLLQTVESLFSERDENLWGSMVKQTLKRKRPTFSESYYGYRSFNELLEDAQRERLLELEKDPKSGGYLVVDFGPEAVED
jgi:uncharacterized protein (TIGR00288 family)